MPRLITVQRHAGINGELQPEEDTFELSMEDLSNFVVEGKDQSGRFPVSSTLTLG